MKKKNMIIIGVIALILVVAVGYALFSDTLTINGSATAKGDFKMTVTCLKGVDTSFGTDFSFLDKEGGYTNDICSVQDNKMTFSVEFLYPGSSRLFTAKIKNEGTIDASVDMNSIPDGNGTTCYDNNGNGSFEEDECTEAPVMGGLMPYGYEKADGTKIDLNAGDTTGIIEGDNIIVKPGDTLYLLTTANFDKGYGNDGPKSFKFKQDYTYEFTFTQKQ